MARGKQLGGDGEPPSLEPAWHFFWAAFWDLGTERPIGMGLGPIPDSALREYARHSGVTGDLLDSFKVIIRAVDAEYLRLVAPKDRKQGNVVRGDDVEGVKALLSRASKRPGD